MRLTSFFAIMEHHGHNHVYQDTTYVKEFYAAFHNWLETLAYDYHEPENQERFIADKADYIHHNLDREQWSHMLNLELFEKFVDFYDAQLER
ncbi:MAG: hypothetical protein IJV50_08585 [Lachnospiraceae bacterium]|nr:hypothetical protein [Lachnospiraceae bacterium]